MKYYFSKLKYLLIGLWVIVFIGCQKQTDGKELTYEVLITSGTWVGGYTDNTGAATSVSNGNNGWKYTFKLQQTPFVMYVMATANGGAGAVIITINFYQNGNQIKSTSSNNGMAFLQYQIN